MGQIVKWVLLLAIIGVLALFVLQNMNRTPTLDTNGAYLSLDLYVWGLEQREPISLAMVLLGCVYIGNVHYKTSFIAKWLMLFFLLLACNHQEPQKQ